MDSSRPRIETSRPSSPTVTPLGVHMVIQSVALQLGPVRPGGQGVRRPQKGHRLHRYGGRYLARVLGEAGFGASRTNMFLGERYRRIARRRGKEKAVIAVGRSILVIVWYLLRDEGA
jgi:hypothetical protein